MTELENKGIQRVSASNSNLSNSLATEYFTEIRDILLEKNHQEIEAKSDSFGSYFISQDESGSLVTLKYVKNENGKIDDVYSGIFIDTMSKEFSILINKCITDYYSKIKMFDKQSMSRKLKRIEDNKDSF